MSSTPSASATPRAKEFNKYKLVFVGDVEVGKTSVIGRYVYGVFNDSYQNTIGIDFLSKSIKLEEQGRAVRLQLWDTAGQERFRSLIPSYIRDASAVMVVYDITNRSSFINTASWIQNVREQQGADATIVLVANKADLEESRKVSTEEGQEAARRDGMLFFEVSAKSGSNIEELFLKLVAALPAQAAPPPAAAGAVPDGGAHDRSGHKLKIPEKDHGGKCAC